MFCDVFNCQLSISDIFVDFIIALIMASMFVALVEYHLTKFRLWKVCNLVKMELKISKKKKTADPLSTNIPTNKEMRNVIRLILNYEKLILDVVSIEHAAEMRHDIMIYREGLECKDADLTANVFNEMSAFTDKLMRRYQPPRYIMITAKYFGSLRPLG